MIPDASDWDALLAEFRALGGEAENVMLREGTRGRGVFAVDPSQPVKLRVPANLLIRGEDTEIRDGQLVVKPSAALGERERKFFDRYQQNFSWGAGVFDHLRKQQLAWSGLSPEVLAALRQCWPVTPAQVCEPSPEICLQQYLRTRVIRFRDARVIFPVAELVNHGGDAAGYDLSDGVAVRGNFEDEVLVNYCSDDCWGMAIGYGFCEARPYAYSVACAFKFEDFRIAILRQVDRLERYNGFAVPIMGVDGNTVRLSFLMLGNTRYPRVPRSVFRHIMKDTPVKRTDELFDLIQHQNRLRLLKFLRSSEGSTAELVTTLRSAAYQQLETLSNHFGSRSLEAVQES